MLISLFMITLALSTQTLAKTGRCDQTPIRNPYVLPSKNNGTFLLSVETKDEAANLFQPGQTYVLTLTALNNTRPFRAFMITAEDPNLNPDDDPREVDVGILKTLDTDIYSRYSERCYATVENTDFSDKSRVQIHWVSPRSDRGYVRIRAMVLENNEVWYIGGDEPDELSIVLKRNDNKPKDSPPIPPRDSCDLCTEARYEIFFHGKWSRLTHPKKYPTKYDGTGYSEMIGASHDSEYVMWKVGTKASDGIKLLAEEGNVTLIEREIIDLMSETNGTRTLIRGKKHIHPSMSEPSHSLFRVDRVHHQFSIAVAMMPSPDWFLGVSKFELCTDDGWLEKSTLPMFPWDAGTMDGVSYETTPSVTQPVGAVARVEVGSFDKESPFHRMNLNDLKPFAEIEVRRLDVYQLKGEECSGGGAKEENGEQNFETQEAPETLASKSSDKCPGGIWTEWSPCTPIHGDCGVGTQIRVRTPKYEYNGQQAHMDSYQELQDASQLMQDREEDICFDSNDQGKEEQECYVMCY